MTPRPSRSRTPRGGESIYFGDPDGHLLELAAPGLWPGARIFLPEDELGRRATAKLLTRDEARRIAANITQTFLALSFQTR